MRLGTSETDGKEEGDASVGFSERDGSLDLLGSFDGGLDEVVGRGVGSGVGPIVGPGVGSGVGAGVTAAQLTPSPEASMAMQKS